MVSCTPLTDEKENGQSCVLEIGIERGRTIRLLLDCGWTWPYNVQLLEDRYRGFHTDVEGDGGGRIDGILISHPDQEHMGGLAYLVHKMGWHVPVFVTGAGHKMGQMVAYDAYLNAYQSSASVTPFDLDDVDAAFREMTQVRYRQEVSLCEDRVHVTPYPAGRLVGGAIWKIHVGQHDIVYAVDYNHKRELHLMGSAMMDLSSMLTVSCTRPAMLITDARSVDRVPVPVQYSKNQQELINLCMTCLRSEGNVLIPVDAAGRVLELLLLLNTYWREKNLTYPLAAVGPMIHTTLEFARSQLEWMNEELTKGLGHSRMDNPLALKCVTPCASMKEVKQLSRGPKVVLATTSSMDDGASRTLFSWWASQRNSAIVIALDPEKGTFAHQVLQAGMAPRGAPPRVLRMSVCKRVALKGEELEEYTRQQAKNADGEKVDVAMEEEKEDEEEAGVAKKKNTTRKKSLHTPQAPTRESVTVIEHAARDGAEVGHVDAFDTIPGDEDDLHADDNVCLVEGFEVPIGVAAPMFPDEDEMEKIEYDDYGAVVDLEEFEKDTSGGGVLSRALASEAAAERYAAEEGDDMDDVVEPEVPTKIESKDVTIQLLAQVVRLDFDGRSDGASVQTMLSKIAPRTCAIVHGSETARSKLASSLMKDLEGLNAHVFAPHKGESISIDLGPAQSSIMSDSLYKSIQMHPMVDVDLGWVDAQMAFEPQRVESGEGKEEYSIVLGERQGKKNDAGHGGVFIGDVKLSQLKRALARINIGSEFHAGGLYCEGDVLVKRQPEGGGLVIEGSLCDEYFRIRDIVYSQYHIC